MVGDLFHYGHAEYLRQIRTHMQPEDKLYVGVHNDITVESYKGTPIQTMDERIKIISCCKYIDKVIPDAPLNITQSYVDYHKINIIYVPSNRTEEEIQLMVSEPYAKGMVKKIPYTSSISTTMRIERIIKSHATNH